MEIKARIGKVKTNVKTGAITRDVKYGMRRIGQLVYEVEVEGVRQPRANLYIGVTNDKASRLEQAWVIPRLILDETRNYLPVDIVLVNEESTQYRISYAKVRDMGLRPKRCTDVQDPYGKTGYLAYYIPFLMFEVTYAPADIRDAAIGKMMRLRNPKK